MNRLKVVIFEPGKPGRVDYVPDKPAAFRHVVGGTPKMLQILTDLAGICNGEKNRERRQTDDTRMGIAGTFFLAGYNREDGLLSLTREQADFLIRRGGT